MKLQLVSEIVSNTQQTMFFLCTFFVDTPNCKNFVLLNEKRKNKHEKKANRNKLGMQSRLLSGTRSVEGLTLKTSAFESLDDSRFTPYQKIKCGVIVHECFENKSNN